MRPHPKVTKGVPHSFIHFQCAVLLYQLWINIFSQYDGGNTECMLQYCTKLKENHGIVTSIIFYQSCFQWARDVTSSQVIRIHDIAAIARDISTYNWFTLWFSPTFSSWDSSVDSQAAQTTKGVGPRQFQRRCHDANHRSLLPALPWSSFLGICIAWKWRASSKYCALGLKRSHITTSHQLDVFSTQSCNMCCWVISARLKTAGDMWYQKRTSCL